MRAAILGLLTATTLAACGGGGGDDAPNAPAPELVTITSANAPTIAAAVLSTTLDTESLGSIGGLGAIGVPTSVAGPPALAQATLGELASTQTDELMDQAAQGVLAATLPEEVVPCDAGGTMTINAVVANSSTLTIGDTFSFEFAACDQGDGTLINGTFAMTVSAFSGDLQSGAILLGMSVTVSQFTVDDGVELASVDGGIDLVLDLRSPTVSTVSISTAHLSVTAGGQTHTLSDFAIVQRFDASESVAYSLDASGTLTSTAFAGTVEFETTALLQSDGTSYAVAGEILIHGASGTSIRAVILDSQSVELRIDRDGDGVVDETVIRSWDELV